MEMLLSLLIAVVRALFGANETANVIAKIEETFALLSRIGADTEGKNGIEFEHTRINWLAVSGQDRPITKRLLKNGAVVIGASGVAVPDEIVGLGEFLGYLSKGGGDGKSPTPSIGAWAWGYFVHQAKVVKSRLTIFNKSVRNNQVYDLRIQTNLMFPVPQSVVPGNLTLAGDPVRYTITLFERHTLMNLATIRNNFEEFIGWTLVVQARLEPVFKDGAWRQGDPSEGRSEKGAKVDWHNMLSGSQCNPWLLNCTGDYILWLLPPNNDFVLESLMMERKGISVSTVRFGAQEEVETPEIEAKEVKLGFMAGIEIE